MSPVNGIFEIRIHGRGGQGVVTAAELLALGAFLDHRFAQAFPNFGSERMGAPVMAFCRISEQEIRLREPVTRPDGLIIQDPTLLHQVDLFSGLRSSGYLLLNTSRELDQLGLGDYRLPSGHIRSVPATEIAWKHTGRPIPNAALVGAFAALTGCLSLESVREAIFQRFGGKIGQSNVAAADAAYEAVRNGKVLEKGAERHACSN
jgi:pyruvate ferredoxin oxidoreductase gamma subunit